MGCFGFGSRSQSDNRLNFHDPPAQPVRAQRYNGPRPEPFTENARPRIQNHSRNASSASAHRTAASTQPPSFAGSRDERPSGLFADVKPPSLSHHPQRLRNKRSNGEESIRSARSNMTTRIGSSLAPIDDNEERMYSPVSEKANRVLGLDSDPAIRHSKRMTDMRRDSKDDFLHPATAMSSPASSLNKESATTQRKQRSGARPEKRRRRPRPVELPGTFPDTMEKQVVGPAQSLHSAQSYSTLGYETDSAIELLSGSYVTRASSPSTIAELQGSEIATPPSAVELPGSNPFVAYEVEAGPMPPCELPGSFTFLDRKDIGMVDLPNRKAHALDQRIPEQHVLYGNAIY